VRTEPRRTTPNGVRPTRRSRRVAVLVGAALALGVGIGAGVYAGAVDPSGGSAIALNAPAGSHGGAPVEHQGIRWQ